MADNYLVISQILNGTGQFNTPASWNCDVLDDIGKLGIVRDGCNEEQERDVSIRLIPRKCAAGDHFL